MELAGAGELPGLSRLQMLLYPFRNQHECTPEGCRITKIRDEGRIYLN